MKTLLLIWSLAIGHCLAGPLFFGQQCVVAASSQSGPAPPSLSVTTVQYLRADSLVTAGGTDGVSQLIIADYDLSDASAPFRLLKTNGIAPYAPSISNQ